jgi:thioredoxin 1
MANVLKVNDSNFESEVLKASEPVLLDFSATWCGPCKQLAPIVEEIAKEYSGRVKVGAVDVEESPDTAVRFRVLSVPTLILIKDGQVRDQIVGLVPKTRIADLIARVL